MTRPLLLLKARVRGHTRRKPGGGTVLVLPYSTRGAAARVPRQGELFAPRQAPAAAPVAPPPPRTFAATDPTLHQPDTEGLTGATCVFCGQPERVAVDEIWSDHNFQLDTCCPALLDHVSRQVATDPTYAAALADHLDLDGLAGRPLRRIASPDEGMSAPILDYQPEVRPLDRAAVAAFIARWHRHNPPLPGDVFRAGVWNGGDLMGVVQVGFPAARALMPAFQAKQVIEVRRLCIRTDLPRELTWRAASTLYRHAADEAERRGFHKIITYTLAEEPGMSLRYARWKPEAETRGGSWSRPSRPRDDKAPTGPKVRWSKRLFPAERPTA
jgi:hypothetical protein